MYELNFVLPESMKNKNIILKMDKDHKLLKQIIDKNFQGAALRKTGKYQKTNEIYIRLSQIFTKFGT